MPVRIEIELTSSAPDGSWTWRAAGAREPRGVLDGAILPGGATVGDQLRVETEKDIDGIRVVAVVPPKEKSNRTDKLELLPTDETFEPVVQHRAPGGGRDDRGSRGPRRDRPEGGRRGERRDDRRPAGTNDGGDRGGRGDRRDRGDRGRQGDRPEGGERGEDRRRHRPHFTPPPEIPQRPKPKRLRAGKQHRTDVLGSLAEEQRTVAELALQGLAAVRQRLREDNARLRSEGKPEMPEAAVLKMAEELIPRLRVADWLDRAEAAKRQLEHLDLRDLRSVVASADDPVVARDESTRELAAELKQALIRKQDEELALWLTDVEAALDVGRVVRALRLSSVPPKAGVLFPTALAQRLGEATTTSLQPTDGPDRWVAVLEAAAFSPVRALVAPAAPAEQRSDELLATVRRLGPLLPQVAAIYDIEVPSGGPVPKPLRPTTRRPEPKKAAAQSTRRTEPARPARPSPAANGAPPAEPAAEQEQQSAPAADNPPVETPPVVTEAQHVVDDVQVPDSPAVDESPISEWTAADEGTLAHEPAPSVGEPDIDDVQVADPPAADESPVTEWTAADGS